MEPLTTALGASVTAKQLLGGLVDRWQAVRDAEMDEKAMIRLLLLECRRNLAVLDVAVGRKEPIVDEALWHVPSVLQLDALEAVLGQGKAAAGVFKVLKDVAMTNPEVSLQHSGALSSLYVRITSLQGLSFVNSRAPLTKVRIRQRLVNLERDIRAVVLALSSSTAIRSAAI
jgi:hypothetical protein